MAFDAKLEYDGAEFDVLRMSYKFSRTCDAKGQPATDINGGLVHITIQSIEDNTIFINMVDSYALKGAKVTITQADEEAELRTVELEDAFLVKMKESIDYVGDNPATIEMMFSAKKIMTGTAEYDSGWIKSDRWA